MNIFSNNTSQLGRNNSDKALSIKKRAKELGFENCGIARADFLEEEAPRLESWLKNNYHGKMAYMANHFDKRLDPRLLVDGAKSVISLTYNYFPEKKQPRETYQIAKYAYGEDYHFVVKDKLKELLQFIQESFGKVNGRVFVDSAPVLEHAWAQKAGIGWIGKNTLMISKQKGSFFFLAEIIIDLELEYDEPFQTDHCGTCTKCIDACPTEAILPNRQLNGSQCISYFTIELKDEIPQEMSGKFQDWVFGCDICQDVCPWNRFSLPTKEERFRPRDELVQFSKQEWREITEETFNYIFKKSPVKRAKFAGLLRNIQFVSKDENQNDN